MAGPGFRWRCQPGYSAGAMKRIVFAAIFAVLATAASAQSLVTVPPGSKMEAWWLRAQFHPMHTECAAFR